MPAKQKKHRQSLYGYNERGAASSKRGLYKKWRIDNPTAKLTIDDMAKIEIQAMKNAGIPEDVATGWVVKALEKFKTQGVNITNIPWNGAN